MTRGVPVQLAGMPVTVNVFVSPRVIVVLDQVICAAASEASPASRVSRPSRNGSRGNRPRLEAAG